MNVFSKIWEWFKKVTIRVELFRLINLLLWFYLPVYSYKRFIGGLEWKKEEGFIQTLNQNVLTDDLILFISWCICSVLIIFGVKLVFIRFFSGNFFQMNYFSRFIIPMNYRFAFKQLINNSVRENVKGMKEIMDISNKPRISSDQIKDVHLYVDLLIKLIVVIAISGNFSEISKCIVSSVSIFLLIGLLLILLRDLTILSGMEKLNERFDHFKELTD